MSDDRERLADVIALAMSPGDAASVGNEHLAAADAALMWFTARALGRTEVVYVHHHDIEKHAESYNEGFEAAVTQGLADDPTLAQDWLAAHDAAFEARVAHAEALLRTARATIRDLTLEVAHLHGQGAESDAWRQMKAQRDAARADYAALLAAAATPSVDVQCPECSEQITVPIVVTMTGEPAQQWMTADPDFSDLWAHAWTHETKAEGAP